MKFIKQLFKIYLTDPIKNCTLYREQGCSHVDGFLCDFDSCSMRKEYELSKLEQELDIPYKLRYYKNLAE